MRIQWAKCLVATADNKNRPVVADHIAVRAQEAQRRIDFLLAMEAEVKTRNVHYFRAYRDKFLALYRGVWRRRSPKARRILDEPSPSPSEVGSLRSQNSDECGLRPVYAYEEHVERMPTALDRALRALGELGLRNLEAKDLLTLLRSDPEEDALFIMANVRAYFQGMSVLFSQRAG